MGETIPAEAINRYERLRLHAKIQPQKTPAIGQSKKIPTNFALVIRH